MKRQLFFTAIAGLFTTMASAADLIVRDGGADGAFSTISAAISQASDGDRIIIRPKVGNLPYQENILVNKSLTFVSEIQGDQYEINGSFTIQTMENRTVTIHDANIVNGNDLLLSGTFTGDRMTVNVMNCAVADEIKLDTPGVTANIYGSTAVYINMVHGKAIANQSRRIYVLDDTYPMPAESDIYLIANKVIFPATGSYVGSTVSISSSQYTFHVYNNFIQNSLGGPAIAVPTAKTGATNDIMNNFVYANISPNGNIVNLGATQVCTINVLNNAFDAGNYQYLVVASAAPYVVVQYNVMDSSSSNQFQLNGVDVGTNNTNGNYGLTSDGVVTGTVLTNAGNPDGSYADLDLSINDVGVHGGSYAWANYWTGQTAKPHVFFLDTPRRVFNGTTAIFASGEAVTK
ncbi:MAG: hypothetical protein EOO50_15295 [Flavobacterium sp.]|uniref:hypothetical protein n=1 Tax=Flavobacterium sp. TaxID=239 RepID=UPI001201D66D|nr:hypothetical protein [Flavobacterium sp.]RZJ64566.1 MAG: hypothetical protein EOO50_15295 [Flavobacterium sp.]